MEQYVRQYLDDNHIMYDAQKTYDDLLGVGNGKLSYDFLIYKNDMPYMFIECQGEQHYRPIKWFGGEQRFEIQKRHDKLKRDYADKLRIPLLEIKYTYDSQDKITKYLDDNI